MEYSSISTWMFLFVFVANIVFSSAKPPHIVFIVADDLGWNDVGWHNPDMKTPNLDRLAMEGVRLNQSYVQPLCTPSRTAFMTGTYPWKLGMQHLTLGLSRPSYVPLNKTFLPQELKKVGYATHAIGKWHLGNCKWECTPTYRGFDTFFGYYGGAEHYYLHKTRGFLDFRDNTEPAEHYEGQYSAHIFAKKAEKVIKEHDASTPLFLYLAFQSVHNPLMVPKSYENMYPEVANKKRRTYCGMVSALDEAVGNVTNALNASGLLKDTLIVFTTDNGGPVHAYANNFPLRGGKHTVFEGGTRGVAFVHGQGLVETGHVYTGMIHAIDWMPTLLSVAGAPPVPDVDGVDQWLPLSRNLTSNRSDFVYNFDDILDNSEGHAAIRFKDYKLIVGYPGWFDEWVRPMNSADDNAKLIPKMVETPGDTPVRLFNLAIDPTESKDIAAENPTVVTTLMTYMLSQRKQMVPADYPPTDPRSDPRHFHNVWSPGWC